MSATRFSSFRRSLLPLLLAACTVGATARAQNFEEFDPTSNSNVFAMVQQPDGRLIVAGAFTAMQPNRANQSLNALRLARLNLDGSLDTSFGAETDGDVLTLALQADGKILLGGKFTQVWDTASFTQKDRAGLARLNPDGSVDDSFDPNPSGVNYTPNALVRALAVQPDGRILVGGAFNAFQPGKTGSPITRNRIARLNADGSVDATFDPNANNVVLAFAVQPDGRILIGGGFTRLQPNGATAPIARARLARLNADGTVDGGFDPRPNNRVLAFALLQDGGILIGGDFTSLQPAGSESATTRTFFARLTSSGALDMEYDPSPDGAVLAIGVQTDGKVLLGGGFGTFRPRGNTSGTSQAFLARIDIDGTVDASFRAGPDYNVTALALQADRSVLVGGLFTAFRTGDGNVVLRRRVAHVLADGLLDVNYNLEATGTASVLLHDGDNIVIAGGFGSLASVSRSGLARISNAGVLDPGFAPTLNGAVQSVARQSDGKLIVGGSFTRVNGVDRPYLARLNADGTLDTAFNCRPNGAVSTIVIQSDNKILIGGSFVNLLPTNATETAVRVAVARLNADGTLDTGFDPNPNTNVSTIVVQSDGKILLGGSFTYLQPNSASTATSRLGIARVNADGTLDTDFAPFPDDAVTAIAVQGDGKIIIGGSFGTVQSSGTSDVYTRNTIARLNADGTVETTFDPNTNGQVLAIVLRSDGGIIIGGTFSALRPNGASGSTNRGGIAWLNSDGTLDSSRIYQVDSSVVSLLLMSDGGVVAGGNFTRINTTEGAYFPVQSGLARFNADGTPATLFTRGAAGIGGAVGAIAVDPIGQVVMGGEFSALGGSENQNLIRTLPNGRPDTSFVAKTDGPVNAVLVPPTSEDIEQTTGPLARLAATGALSEEFDRTASSQLHGSISAAVVLANNQVIVGGIFGNSAGTTGGNLVRFNPDGTLDTSFNPGIDGGVQSLAVQADGKILVGGRYEHIQGVARNNLSRLNADGSLDATFDPNVGGGAVYSILPLADGKMYVGGTFATFKPNGATETITRNYLARLNADGTVDTAFTTQVDADIRVIVRQGDGKLLLGGFFSAVGGEQRYNIARLNADGTLDADFDPSANGAVIAIAVQADGKILLGGVFSTLTPNEAEVSTIRYFLARVNSDGTLDEDFNPVPNGEVDSIAVVEEGAILLGGRFTAIASTDAEDYRVRLRLARLTPEGIVDLTYNPIAGGMVTTIIPRPDGTTYVAGEFSSFHTQAVMLIGGSFANVGDVPMSNLVRLADDGSPDIYYRPEPDGAVYALSALPDRSTLVAGAFTHIFETARGGLALLDGDGVLDLDFDPAVNGTVRTVAQQPDGRFVIGGDFATVAGASHQRLARINADGTADNTFTASADGTVVAVAMQADGRIVVAGEFTNVNGTGRSYLARLDANGSLDTTFAPDIDGEVWTVAVQADGGMLIGGAFTHVGGAPHAHLARLERDGSVDASFTAGTDGDVLALMQVRSGRIFVGGQFETFGGLPTHLVARMANPISMSETATISDDGSTFTWRAYGGGVEYASVRFASSTDATEWTELGSGTRTGAPGTWQISGLSLPSAGYHFIRAQATATSTRNLSSSPFETSWQFYGHTLSGYNPATGGGAPGGPPPTDADVPADNPGDTPGDDPGAGDPVGDNPGGDNPGDPGYSPVDYLPPDQGGAPVGTYHLANFSVRAQPKAGDALILGFVNHTAGTQRVLLRAVGPGLDQFGVGGTMPAPRLELFRDVNTGSVSLGHFAAWGGNANVAAVADQVFAFPLETESADAAVVATLVTGQYTIHVGPNTGANGVVLGEVYLAVDPDQDGGMANLSARGPVGVGDAVLIGGFIIPEDAGPRRVLIRGMGPSLAQFGVGDALANPALHVYRNLEELPDELVAVNDDWQTQSGPATAAEVQAAATSVSAFQPLEHDAAVVLTLQPGAYTAQISGATPGTALVEVWELP